ncbi:MAG: hypothetical protein EBR46_08320, partial [Betaproteobacteria bacterium]|nr:hypothetical protein [Betaproteobacteria bacterium]
MVSISSRTTPWVLSRASAWGTSGSFLKPKFSVTAQQSWPRASTCSRSLKPTQGTSWWRTVTNRLRSCSTLLCLRLCILATIFFFIIDVAFLSSNLLKLFAGGWFPLAIGLVMFTLMLTWRQGSALLRERLRDEAIPLQDFLDAVFVHPPTRVPGTAVFMTPDPGFTPTAMMHNLKHNKVLHERNLFVTVRHHDVPWIGFNERLQVDALGHDCWAVTLNFGFKNEPDV